MNPVINGKIAAAYSQQENEQCKYPPSGSHKRKTICKSEGSGGTSSVEEEVRIIVSFRKLPAQNISYSRIDGI